jgi:release factor glutamine methyltransferase
LSVRIIAGLKAGASLQQACELMAQAFRAAGIEDAKADARILTAHALKLSRAQLISQGDRELEPREIDALSARAARRLKREPVSRIVGEREFWGLRLNINAFVLDPRPETETLVEAALDWMVTRHLRNEAVRVLDVGTGSGALLLALLSELPAAIGVATDKSFDALACARANAQRLGLAHRCMFAAGDYATALRGPFDLVVCNPPYIASGDITQLDPEVRDYDPRLALDGGADGLDAYRAIVNDAPRLLAPRGRLIVELGQGQADAVADIAERAGLSVAALRADLGGLSRALCASKP